MKKIILSVLALIIALTSSIVVVFGWLTVGTQIQPNYTGSVLSAYFASGDGASEATAYEINSPTHLFNLTWLQNNGEFNSRQYYFKITADLDMKGYVLPPIGTMENPFIGNLNGGGYTISNLTVSNVIKEATKPNEVSRVPNSYNAIGDGHTDIVGFFGVIGHYPGETSCPNNVSVSNLYLDNITIRTRTSNSLIGLFAGYICGNVSNVGVYRSMVSIGADVSTLSSSGYTAHSKYSLIGDYDKNTTGWESVEGGSGGSEGAGFGGSIDMQLLSRRVNYMTTRMLNTANVTPGTIQYVINENPSYCTANNQYKYTGSTSFNINMYRYSSIPLTVTKEFYWDMEFGDTITTKELTSHLLKHTYLPLNVNLNAMGLDNNTEITLEKSETPQEFHINKEYLAATSETVSNSNTGYIVGGAEKESSLYANARLNIRLLNRNDGYTIYKSLGSERTSVSYDKNKLVLISTDSNGSFGWIEDSYNSSTYKDNTSALKVDYKTAISSSSFNRYDAVVEQFHTLLSSSDNIYGLLFSSKINLENKINGSGVILNGTPYDNYEFLDSSVNFNLNQSGYMTAIIGTYYSNSSGSLESGFSLYQVIRDNNKIVTDTTKDSYTREITSVWKNASGDIKYNYGDTAVSSTAPADGYTKVYDKYWYSRTMKVGTAYYIEIPLVSGDYAIGAMDGYFDYLMYLDIGANGASSGGGTTPTYKIEGVRFVYLLNEAYDTLKDLYTFEIVRLATTNGAQIYFLMTGSAMCYYIDPTYDTANTQVNLTNNALSATTNDSSLKTNYGGTKQPPS